MFHIDDYSAEALKEIVSDATKFELWNIHKDLIAVCRDCEYRHMCVDERIPVKDVEGTWSHKTECNYNPYSGQWLPEMHSKNE